MRNEVKYKIKYQIGVLSLNVSSDGKRRHYLNVSSFRSFHIKTHIPLSSQEKILSNKVPALSNSELIPKIRDLFK